MTTPLSESTSARARSWLADVAIPTWLERGFDPRLGCFHEGLHADLTPVLGSVRTMVQARQIYSFRLSLDLELCPMERAARAVTAATRFILDQCARADGAFVHSVNPGRGFARETPDLYTQAFVLFGLNHAFRLSPLPEYRARALALVRHLAERRAVASGGYFELDAVDQAVHRSNPLMHLFEAALSWVETEPDEPRWSALARELCELALTRLVDRQTGALAENFDADWVPEREGGRFYWEPGHQFEWAWLLGRYDRALGADTRSARNRLYNLATEHGVIHGRAIDQVWSDFTPRARSARFWPQAERAKVAVQRGDTSAAEEAIGALSSYLDHPRAGLWCDTIDEAGRRDLKPSKASSLYHIIGALTATGDER